MLERSDRILLIGAATIFVIVGLAAALLSRPAAEIAELQVASSERVGPGGAKATYLLLDACGYTIRRSALAPHDLPPIDADEGTLLVIAQPTERATNSERAALESWVRGGGELLVAIDGDSLAPGFDTSRYPGADTGLWSRRVIRRESRRAASVRMMPGAHEGRVPDSATVLYGTLARPVVLTYPWGRGRVTWWAGATPLTNQGMMFEDNLALLFDTLGEPGARVILWDEYFHGDRGSLSDYLMRTPLKGGLLQLLALFAVLLASWARRFGPVRAPASESRASRLEFVEALGGLYARAGAAAVAMQLTHDDVRRRLARRLGMPPSTRSAALASAAAERLGAGGPSLAALFDRAEAAGAAGQVTTEAEALALAQALDHWDRRWQKGSVAQAPENPGRV